ncbi:MAG TPA: hypothetical protein VMZ28_25025, partial [Kofleriaceae bacterium]|nr:hypothetical protein [Kofleriaceae bacterium]
DAGVVSGKAAQELVAAYPHLDAGAPVVWPQDRAIAFDAREGLYRGETSFLDWREQTYPAWTARDTVHIGMSRALSTNAAHLRLLHLAADLADERADRRAARWRTWAGELRLAMRDRFALEGTPLLSAYRPSELDPAPVRRFDLLGLALAVDAGVVSGKAAQELVAAYPHLDAGAPVVWPQDRDVPIYHNRAIWPFVTAHWLRAARRTWNDTVVEHEVLSMVRIAALNLSHQENVEALSGAAWVEDGPRSGPVVNSPRQLWSVAGFLSMVEEVLLGLESSPEGVRVRPMVPRGLRRRLLGSGRRIVLDGVRRGGAELTVVVALPELGTDDTGAYGVGTVRLDGEPVPGGLIPRAALTGRRRVDVELVDRGESFSVISAVVDTGNGEAWYAPRAPELTALEADGGAVRLRIAPPAAEDPARIGLRVYRDGAVVAELPGDARSFTDAGAAGLPHAPCYAVEAFYRSGPGNTSHRAQPRCWEGARGERRRRVTPAADGRFAIHAAQKGEILLRVIYENPGPFNTGVTCAVRRLEVVDDVTGQIVAAGPVLLPHTGDAATDPALGSSWVRAELPPGRHHVRLVTDERTVNMSAFQHFALYTGGAGGAEGPRNTAEILALDLLALSGRLGR